MRNLIVNTTKRAKRIVNTSPPARSLEADIVASALDGQPTGFKLENDTNPISLFQVRMELSRMLTSTGGRPSLAGMQDKVKIPRFAEDWVKIEALAAAAAEGMPFRPTAAQVATVLLHEALERLSNEEARSAVRKQIAA